MKIIITSPTLDQNKNVSGISAVTNIIIENNKEHEYLHFEIGSRDGRRSTFYRLITTLRMYFKWIVVISQKYQLVHFNLPFTKLSLIRDLPLILCLKFFNKKFIIHIHGGEYLNYKKVNCIYKGIINLIMHLKCPKIVLSGEEENYLIQYYKAKSIFVIPNAVNLKINALTLRPEYKNILFMGRIHKEKGIFEIMSALDELKRRNYRFKFVICGAGPDRNNIEKSTSEILKEDIIFKGVVKGKEKDDILKNSDIFLLPSYFEGLPIALLEAMSYGLVPIVTDLPSMKNIINNDYNGLIVQKNDSQSIVNALIKIMEDNTYANKIAFNSFETIKKYFNVDIFIDKLNEVYNNE